ncbi:reverse transcriptase, partial [Globisporangium splendens]
MHAEGGKAVKLGVAKYGGGDKEPLLRWFVEIDAAIRSGQIHDPEQQVDFAMSKLAERAKSWAFGRRMADHHCFRTLAEFKSDIRASFEPPKSEFRTRTEFLEIRQDRRDLHAYIQHARYLVSSIVSEPIDMATQVATFMKGLTDGHVKTYLFREYPETLEQATALALQEDFSAKQARLHANPLRAAHPSGGHLGREKTFLSLSRDYYWPHMYKWVRKYVRTCEICQRAKPSGSAQAPLRSLAVPSDSWKSVSVDFIFGLPRDKHGRNGILVFVDRFSKMVHLAPVSDKISAEKTAKVFVDVVFRLHRLPVEIVSDRDTRFTSKFWRALFGLLDTKLPMSTAAHPETDGQTERVNRVLEDVLRSYATSFKEWSEFLPLAEFALNNSTHVSTGHSPFYVNYGIHPRVPASIMGEVSTLSGGGTPAHGNKPKSSYDLNAASELKANFDSMKPLDGLTSREEQQVDDFVVRRQAVVRFVRDAITKAQDLQKEQADKSGRKNKQVL